MERMGDETGIPRSCKRTTFYFNPSTWLHNANSNSPFGRPKSREWIDRLNDFKSFLRNVGLEDGVSVKVALLDDGSKLQELNGKQKGQSFRPDNEEFFVGPCSHGTQMARCIRSVCPMAELYIARLDDSRQSENQKFTISSCHEVSIRRVGFAPLIIVAGSANCLVHYIGATVGFRYGSRRHLDELDVREEG